MSAQYERALIEEFVATSQLKDVDREKYGEARPILYIDYPASELEEVGTHT